MWLIHEHISNNLFARKTPFTLSGRYNIDRNDNRIQRFVTFWDGK